MILAPPPPVVTWIRVPKPTFDLIGVIISSLLATAVFAALAALAGAWLGALLIRRRGRTVQPAGVHLTLLRLGEQGESARADPGSEAVSSS